ncbi:MAG: hypothetical protein JW973_17800 [Bacteroidales bacterium]|nr:hypothetical protein [Bacteroidales bacterium]
MKKVIFSIIIINLFITGCFKDEDEIRQAYKVAVMPEITAINASFFDLADINNTYVEFTVDFETPAKSVAIEETFNGYKKTLGSYTSFPATIRITATEAVAGIPDVTIDSLKLGDSFLFEIIAEATNGIKSRSNIIVNASVACESDLSGTYDVLANGMSTDPGPTPDENPAVDFVYEVTLTETTSNGVYTISDFSGGLYPLWYDIYGLVPADCEGTLQDICGSISYVNTIEPFGSPIEGTGNVDPVTGIITLDGTATAWGDTWTLVLTPKK